MKDKHRELISRYKYDLLYLDHVVGVGYGLKEKKGQPTDEKAIIVLVDKKIPSDRLKNKDIIPQTLGDYSTDVIEIGELQFFDAHTEKLRPAQPGCSIGHYKISAGTMGAVVKDRKSGNPLILSNNHVLANITNGHDDRAKIGDPILQPGTYDSGSNPADVIARLERFIPVNRNSDETTCPMALAAEKLINIMLHLLKPNYDLKFYRQGAENLVDCAVARPINDRVISDEIIDIGRVQGIKDPEVGMRVQKSGRTSGLTRGTVKVLDTTVQVRMSQSEVAVFEDQFITEPISKAGDSGSLVVDYNNNAVGLLFAGSDQATVCNKITNVLQALDVEF